MKKNYLGAILTGILHLIISAGIFIFLCFFVPKFVRMWDDMEVDIPAMTQLVKDVSSQTVSHWFMIIPLMLALCAISGLIYFFIYLKIGKWQARGYSAVIILVEILLALFVAIGVYLPNIAIKSNEQQQPTVENEKPKEPASEAPKSLTKEQLKKLAETVEAQFITDNPDVDELEVEVFIDIQVIEGGKKYFVEIVDYRVNDTTNIQGLKDIASRIQQLAITSDKLKDISLLKGMPLTELYLACPMLKDISALKGMSSLKHLKLKGCPIKDFEGLSATIDR